MKKADFNYDLPEHLIAQYPLADRTASRLLSVNRTTGILTDYLFTDLIDLLKPGDLLVLNNTRVIPARLYGTKPTGGQVEILIERLLDKHQALVQIRASKSPKPHTIIYLDKGYQCTVTGRDNDLFKVQFNTETPVSTLLEQIGHIPLPPYITRQDNPDDLERYQTVFAQQAGAVAAPTAGLHFNQDLLDDIQRKGITHTFVTLHIGSGTFQPVRVDNLSQHVMHKEYYQISHDTVDAVQRTRQLGGRVIAIGTTAVRALESATIAGQITARQGDTDLFIIPGYRFQSVDAILTNFHLPESTLLMLIAAFAGYPLTMKAYQYAVKQAYRFFSYGDAMFIAD